MTYAASRCDGYATPWSQIAADVTGNRTRTQWCENDDVLLVLELCIPDAKVSKKLTTFIFSAEVSCKFFMVVRVTFSQIWSHAQLLVMPIFHTIILPPSSELRRQYVSAKHQDLPQSLHAAKISKSLIILTASQTACEKTDCPMMTVHSCHILAASKYVFTHAHKYQTWHKHTALMFCFEGGNVFHLNAGPYLQIKENRHWHLHCCLRTRMYHLHTDTQNAYQKILPCDNILWTEINKYIMNIKRSTNGMVTSSMFYNIFSTLHANSKLSARILLLAFT